MGTKISLEQKEGVLLEYVFLNWEDSEVREVYFEEYVSEASLKKIIEVLQKEIGPLTKGQIDELTRRIDRIDEQLKTK
jgi:hypothetical protein